jgi:hypothetical protein
MQLGSQRLAALSFVCAITSCALVGCSVRVGGSKSVDRALADLRDENADLRRQLQDAKGQLAEQTLGASAPSGEFPAAQVALATPRVVEIELASSSGIDTRNPHAPKLI